MKTLKKLLIMTMAVIALAIVAPVFHADVAAAGYPSLVFVSDENFSKEMTIAETTVGQKFELRMKWTSAYEYEGYSVVIKNSKGTAVLNDDYTWQNTDKTRNIGGITWDTSKCEPGTYTVEVTKKFYTMNQWFDAPMVDKLDITLKEYAHSFGDWKITKAATISAEGSKTHTCKYCGTTETQVISKLTPSIKLSKKSITLKKKKSYTVKVTYAKGDSVKSWKSSKKSVAKVTSKGKITAKKKGKAYITCTLKSGKKATVKVTVK